MSTTSVRRGLVGLAAVTATLTLNTAGAPAHAATRSPSRAVAAPASVTCRSAASSISGASLSAKVCWSGSHFAEVNGRVYDTRSDGAYAVFRIQYRVDQFGWQTFTSDLATTRGSKAPASKPASWSFSDSHAAVKDVWVQVCKQGSGHRTCDKQWH